jgi:hypothetical protein
MEGRLTASSTTWTGKDAARWQSLANNRTILLTKPGCAKISLYHQSVPGMLPLQPFNRLILTGCNARLRNRGG